MPPLRSPRSVTFLGLTLLLILPACVPVYVPNTVHTPLLEEKGDLQVGGYVGASGVDLQAAAALTDHVGAFADFSIATESDPVNDDEANNEDFDHRHRFGEVGIGYFAPLGSRGHFEVYGGYGRGWAESSDEYPSIFGTGVTVLRATGRYRRLFVQPGAGVDLGPLRLNGAVRVAHVNFYEFETRSSTVTENQSEFFLEPVVGASLGVNVVRLGAQIGISRPFKHPNDVAFDYQPVIFSLGLQVKVNPLLR